jgi:uncharacterized membrane protein
MYKKFLTLLVLLLIATSVFSECETTPDKINRFEANYSIVDEKNADVSIVLVAEFSEKCIIERIKQSMDLNLDEFEIVSVSPEQITCPTEFLKDRVDRELGDFEEGLTCTATFAQDKNHIRMSFVGTMKIPTQDSGVKTITLLGSEFTNSLPRDSSITITIPSTFTFIEHYPRNGQKTLTKVLWSPTPREQLKLSFSRIEKEVVPQTNNNLIEEFMNNIYIIVGIIAVMIIIMALILLKRPAKHVIIQKQAEAPKENKREAAKLLKEKIGNLERMYLQGKIDETTYRRLIEQYNMQLNDLITEIKREEAKVAS